MQYCPTEDNKNPNQKTRYTQYGRPPGTRSHVAAQVPSTLVQAFLQASLVLVATAVRLTNSDTTLLLPPVIST
jgi:hypothetical protein